MKNFLEQESINANKKRRKLTLLLFLFVSCISVFLYFATKNSIDFNDPETQKLLVIFAVLLGLILFSTLLNLFLSIRPAKNGKNLILPFDGLSKKEAADIINREMAQGKLQYEGFMNYKTIKKYDDRVIVLPSYLLLVEEMGKITAIPRDKIYWTCAQVGYKGGPFYVRLLIFTEKKIFDFDGNDIEHTKRIAEDLYQYIPNVFHEYSKSFAESQFPYQMEHLFTKSRTEFLRLYENEKMKLI